MRAALFGALLLLTACGDAEAATRPPADRHAAMTPFERAATGCFAETVVANPRAVTLARAGRWYEAASVIGFLCRPEVDALIRTHDGLYGRGTGAKYFKTTYARHLGQELAQSLGPLLDRQTVASAEPGVEKASVSEEADKAP